MAVTPSQFREATPEEIENLDLGLMTGEDPDATPGVEILEEQGATVFQRFLVKNLATDPERAKAFFREKLGMEVIEHGSGFNFAFRPMGSDGPFKVVDPAGFEPQDILDFATDIFLGGITEKIGAVGAVGGTLLEPGVGTVAGLLGGRLVGGAVTEVARQKAGKFLGIPDNADPQLVMEIALISALLPAAARTTRGVIAGMVKKFAPGLKEGAATLLGKLAGVPDRPGFSAGEAVITRARLPKNTDIPLPIEVSRNLQTAVGNVLDNKTSERKLIESILRESTETVDLNPAMKRIRSVGRELQEGIEGARPANQLAEEIEAKVLMLMGKGQEAFEDPSKVEAFLKTVPVEIADGVRRRFGKVAKFKSPLAATPASDDLRKASRSAMNTVRKELRSKLGPEYQRLEGQVFAKLTVAEQIQKKAGKMVEDLIADPKGEAFINSLSGRNKSETLALIETFDKLNGTHYLADVRRSFLAVSFPERTLDGRVLLRAGDPSAIPQKFTATGALVGAAFAKSLGVPGGPIIPLMAIPMATERGLVGMTRAGRTLMGEVPLTAGGRGLNRLRSVATVTGAQSATRQDLIDPTLGTDIPIGDTSRLNPERAAAIARLQDVVRKNQAKRIIGGTRRRP